MVSTKRGGDRQALHEVIREHSLVAWTAVREGRANPIVELLCADERITRYVPADEARALLDASRYVGDAPQRAREFAARRAANWLESRSSRWTGWNTMRTKPDGNARSTS